MSRRDPFAELESMLEQLNEERDGGRRQFQVPVDVEDTGEAYEVHADLPGFEKSDIDVELEGRTLHVRASHETEETVTERYVQRERHHESLERSVTLPGEVQERGTSAHYENGVLTVHLPKAGPNEEHIDIE
ncbi:Hsp20/alpha crystallin family protein [Halarchaeum sp. P4]|uniref:Hsp20/alpha crystallin family protein n=1 Tax=Halarchaeum sp. P4 TaxID=3421639 RepID=UPI003EB94D08